MKIGICDDNRRLLPRLEQEIRLFACETGLDTEVFSFHTEKELLDWLGSTSLDLLFLDIEMPGMGGIALAKRISTLYPECQIAFCTNYLEYAPDVYEVQHCYYVLKDEFRSRLPAVLKKVERNRCRDRKIQVRVNRESLFVPVKDILYVERKGKHSYINLAGGSCLKTLKKIDEILCEADNPGIIRCHISFLVSLRKAKKFGGKTFVMEDGTEIPVSRTYRESVRQAFMHWNWMNL